MIHVRLVFHFTLNSKKLIVYQKNCTVNHGSIMYNYVIFIQSMSKNSFVLGYLYFPAPGPQFAFTGPGPQFVFTGPGPQFVFTGPGSKFVFTGPSPQFVFTGPGPNFYLPALVSSKPGLADTNLVPPICIYWPWPTIFITVL